MQLYGTQLRLGVMIVASKKPSSHQPEAEMSSGILMRGTRFLKFVFTLVIVCADQLTSYLRSSIWSHNGLRVRRQTPQDL